MPDRKDDNLSILSKTFVTGALALAVACGAATTAAAAKKTDAATPSPSPSVSAAPLPTATPESPEIAIPRLEAKIKENPSDKESLGQLAGFYLAVNKPDQALGLTQRLLSLGEKSAQTYYLDGIANESLGRIKEATADFEQASNLEPTNPQVLLTLTNLYLQTNRAADAERVAKRATTFNPNDKRAFENYGLVLAQEKKFDDARKQFQASEKIDPKDPLPITLEARSYIDQRSYTQAQEAFDRALQIDPKNGDAMLGKARLQGLNHDVKGSIATYEQILPQLTTDEGKAAILIEEYQVYRDEKMPAEALGVLKRAEQQYGKVAGVHIAYGDYDAGIAHDLPAAETEWKTALGPNRDNPEALTRLGQVALSRNQNSQALEYFKRLTEIASADPGSWLQYGQLLTAQRQYSPARDSFRHSFELARTPQALAGIGTTDMQLNNFKECGQVFDALDRNATDFLKANPQLYYVMGRCYTGNNQRDKARTAYLKFKPFVKAGSPLEKEVSTALQALGARPAPKSKATAAPKPRPSPSPSPKH